MRDAKARAIIFSLAVLTLGLLGGSSVWAVGSTIWPTYHFDGQRAGQNLDSQDLVPPLGLVWVFPRDVVTAVDPDKVDPEHPENDPYIADDSEPLFSTTFPHTAGADDAINKDYRYADAIPIDDEDQAPPEFATWQMPPAADLPAGYYRVYVHIPQEIDPGMPRRTTKANYSVYHDFGVTNLTINQQATYPETGGWVALGERSYSFRIGSRDNDKIVLSSVVGQTTAEMTGEDDEPIPHIVVADAVWFVPDVGKEVYTSPASAAWDWKTGDPTLDVDLIHPTPFVYIGATELPLTEDNNAPDTGAVYCVNSVSPTTQGLLEYPEGTPERDKYDKLAAYLGTALWQYPRADANTWAPTEGPISGGIYASPTLAWIDDNLAPDGRRLVCFVAADDGQVYALDGKTGELIWKGPGLTVSETPIGNWTETVNRRDAYGGKFLSITPVSSGGNPESMVWDFPIDKRQEGGEPSGSLEGWSYAVYAWIPAQLGGDLPRIDDAVYTITYQKYESTGVTNATTRVTVDQSRPRNQGRWVRLGSSYFNVSRVTLSDGTNMKDENGDPIPAGSRVVVADAVMIVPETVGAFGYCTPVTDAPDSVSNANMVFAVNGAGGRVIAFDVFTQKLNSGIGRVKWIYPKVRTKLVASSQADMDQPSLGECGSSPAYWADGDRLYVASNDDEEGRLVCLEAVTGAEPVKSWEFPNAKDRANGDIPAGFTSSPALDPLLRQLFIASSGGYFYCLRMEASGSGGSQIKWKYPDVDAQGNLTANPLARVEYSTPAVATVRGVHRAWVAGADGRVYSFHASEGTPPQGRRIISEFDDEGNLINESNPFYMEPSVLSPIQASIAMDNETLSKRTVMYFGDMKGTLYWFDAANGSSDWTDTTGKKIRGWRTEGALFSSPNVTHVKIGQAGTAASWIYVGCADGRLYAFSDKNGAWGGAWAGGEWPFEGTSGGELQEEVTAAPETEIQFDIFRSDFYQNCIKRNPEPKIGDKYVMEDASFDPPDATKWPDDWAVGEDMKLPPSSDLGSSPDDKKIDDVLLAKAKNRRKKVGTGSYVFEAQARTGQEGVYFEWGESIYCVLWNLPGSEFLYGSTTASKRSSIRFTFSNASVGESAGSMLKLTGIVKELKEYTVLDESTKTTEDIGGENVTHYKPLKYSADRNNKEVKRCYAIAEIKITGTSTRPPSPGPGWVLSAEVRHKQTNKSDAPLINEIIPLARLKVVGSNYEPVYPKKDGTVIGTAMEQSLGINNPLAISDDQGTRIAWPPTADYSTYNRRNDDEAHFNGNAAWTMGSSGRMTYARGKMPEVNLSYVPHGRTSREATIGVIDRSATGCNITQQSPLKTLELTNFRINDEDLRWRGGPDAIKRAVDPADPTGTAQGVWLPWEMGPGSVDYPHIYRRFQNWRKLSDDKSPAIEGTTLPPVILRPDSTFASGFNTNYGDTVKKDTCPLMRPETVFMSVQVPRFQPANSDGYTRTMEAYIDSNGNGSWDSGSRTRGRPASYQEAHRKFNVGLRVPPDPRIEVEEQLVDVGRAPHGLGEAIGDLYYPMNANPIVHDWFKRITIKNAGNVNLKNIRIGKDVPLISDQASPAAPLPGSSIVSSLDGGNPPTPTPFWWMPPPPIFWDLGANSPFVSKDADGVFCGYTLSKPRVGDPDPTIMTLPDRRKWDTNFAFAATQAQAAMAAAGWGTDQPLPVEVGVRVPLTQPIGTYIAPFVPVYSDTNGDGVWQPGEPLADPSFSLKVTVRENQLTGGVTNTTLPQIDEITDPMPRVGDSTPTAFRDPATGNVHLFWSSNRMFDPALYPNWASGGSDLAEFANAPWFINRARLVWDASRGWVPGSNKWWETPAGSANLTHWLPKDQWVPGVLGDLMVWKTVGGTKYYSVRHHSPVIGENQDAIDDDPGATSGLQWLAWVGDANKQDPNTLKVIQDHLIFYTDATHGEVTGSNALIQAVEHDPGMSKRGPSLSVFGNQMWMFWQGGESGQWSVFYSFNTDAPKFRAVDGQGRDQWAPDTKLRTPDCLSTVGSPNAVHRRLWRNLGSDKSSFDDPRELFDVVYAGTGKLTQNSDIILGRYLATTGGAAAARFSPGRRALPLPRVFGEKLERDPKFGFFTSRHLAWTRLNIGRVMQGLEQPVLDSWGAYDVANPGADMPYIHVIVPRGYDDGVNVWPDGAVVSGTDGSIFTPDPNDPSNLKPFLAGRSIMPEVDAATGVYTYKYVDAAGQPTATAGILGDMLVDYSAGIVRFTKPFKELADPASGSVKVVEVYADYTPQSWRLTTDLAADSSARAFLETTNMSASSPPRPTDANPGLCNYWKGKRAPVDRLWVFWRKAGAGIESSTIFYSTYRVGVDLTKLLDKAGKPAEPIKWNTNGFPSDMVQGNLGPWEVERSGKRIYFSGVDERYRSLFKCDTPAAVQAALGAGPGPITIKYTNIYDEEQTVEVPDVFWLNELPEQSLFGFATGTNINEGSIWAFADPEPTGGTLQPIPSSKIWVFWTSTRRGTSDLFWETFCPDFSAR